MWAFGGCSPGVGSIRRSALRSARSPTSFRKTQRTTSSFSSQWIELLLRSPQAMNHR